MLSVHCVRRFPSYLLEDIQPNNLQVVREPTWLVPFATSSAMPLITTMSSSEASKTSLSYITYMDVILVLHCGIVFQENPFIFLVLGFD